MSTEHKPQSERYEVTATVYVSVTVNDPEVIDRVCGVGADEWRAQFYDMWSPEEVVEHFAFNAITNGVHDISRLDGWADCDPAAVTIEVENCDLVSELAA